MWLFLQEEYGVAAIASLMNWQANALQTHLGFSVVTLANRTDINALTDVVGKKVSPGEILLVLNALVVCIDGDRNQTCYASITCQY